MPDQIHINQGAVLAALEARYQQLVAGLVRDNAHLEAYAQQLAARVVHLEKAAAGTDLTEGT